MLNRTVQEWVDLGEAFAFVGNSLLAPMNQVSEIGLDPTFWEGFPDFGSTQVAGALEACKAYAEDAQALTTAGGDPVQRESVEYTKLFIGPPRPAAAPWETMYRAEGVTVGFGEPTFAMQNLLREAGLEMSNKNNQYADHIGIELLYASVLCTRLAEAEDDESERTMLANKLSGFAQEHPLEWIGRLRAAVAESEPDGYIVKMIDLANALLMTLV